MRLVGELSEHELSERLRKGRFRFRVGPYTYNLRSSLPQITRGIQILYPDFQLAEPGGFDDFNVAMSSKGALARLRRKAEFLFDNQCPFGAIPTRQAYAFLEWGLNWCVSVHVNEHLKLHAAAVAKDGRVMLMPGVPGAGKSTLCAALGLSGWRILSDEHALITPGTSNVTPLCRPVSLKNESIAVIQSFSKSALFGPLSEDTHKGTVAHMKADLEPGSHDALPLGASIMLFPRYANNEPQRLSKRHRTESFILAAYHSFNYSLLGEAGFRAMKTLIDRVECYDLVYSDLDWAIQTISDVHNGAFSQ